MDVSHNSLEQAVKEQDAIQKIAGRSFSGDVFLVGGAIREMFLRHAPNDYDLALTNSDDLRKIEETFSRHSFLLGKKPIQTFRISTASLSFDITMIEGSIEEDLRRRDFTVNAIAYDVLRKQIIDPLNGIEDIQQMIIRCPSEDTISKDPLRMLKAVRHFSDLDGFTLDIALLNSIRESKQIINDVAPERIKYELDRILVSHRVADGIALLEDTGLLFEIFPEIYELRLLDIEKQFQLETLGHTLDGFRFLHHYNKELFLDEEALRNVGYAFLFHDLGKANTYFFDEKKSAVHFFYHERFSREKAAHIMKRLRFSTREERDILTLIENHMRIFLISDNESREKAVRRIVYKMGNLTPALVLHTMCDLYGSSGGADNPSTERTKKCCEEILETFKESQKAPLPRLANGNQLIDIGFTPGPQMGACLNDIREKQITGEITNTEQALAYAKEYLKEVDTE
ncbi:MAG TPA: HD domain-containing protein [Syntrophorhabdaceae bacterium]|nr:HD domain-containing protein [Syntrophorhabdaceae bacterium]